MVKKRSIDPSESELYYHKSKEFLKVMHDCYERRQWNGVGLNAVHCSISISDALLAKAGIRNTSANHREAVKLLTQQFPGKETQDKVKHLKKVIDYKNLVEYEGRLFTQKESDTIILHTERFFTWVEEKL